MPATRAATPDVVPAAPFPSGATGTSRRGLPWRTLLAAAGGVAPLLASPGWSRVVHTPLGPAVLAVALSRLPAVEHCRSVAMAATGRSGAVPEWLLAAAAPGPALLRGRHR